MWYWYLYKYKIDNLLLYNLTLFITILFLATPSMQSIITQFSLVYSLLVISNLYLIEMLACVCNLLPCAFGVFYPLEDAIDVN